MMAVCYRLFLTGANAEILDKKTAEPAEILFFRTSAREAVAFEQGVEP